MATRENRPILWKNRDVSNPNQEMRFFSGERFRFIANVYAGETLDVWAGINEAGFAIMNSNSYNLGGGGEDRGGADDGTIMRLALGSCASVEDFERLLDSLNLVGRETPANFGVFDNSGKAAIFEASHTFYTRYDADEESLGFLLRANFSMSGGPTRLLGKNRFERALQLCIPVVK
ncbi:MAG: carcinine hydrolase/isopenicillin-N N-acyltransferase family protein, partial [candidate division WOR-3 bacterium]